MQEDFNLDSSHTYLIVDHRENFLSKCFKRIRSVEKVKAEDEPLQKRKSKNYRPDKIYSYLKNETSKEKSSKENIDELNHLINLGSDVNYLDENGENALHIVAGLEPKEKSIELYDLLIEQKCELKENKCGFGVIHVAAYNNNDVLIEHILKNHPNLLFDVESKKEQQTPLHLAAKSGSKEAVLCLIKKGANKEARDYLERTPLFLAAEYQEEEVVKILIDLGCNVQAKNINGQKALYWIFAKCPHLASEILDGYRTLDKYAYKDIYYLKNMDIEPIFVKEDIKGGKSRIVYQYPYVKSILEYIAEQENMDLISHPVMQTLINFKFNQHLWWFSGKFLVDFLFCVIWNVWAILIRYDIRYMYNFPQEWWRLFLFIVGIVGLIGMIIVEIIEGTSKIQHQNEIQKKRQNEINEERLKSFPKNENQANFISNEEKLNQNSKKFSGSYIADPWNIFDIITIIFVIASLGTHLADILNHSERIARNHIRVTSITVLFVSARVLKNGRILWEPFGMLVMTLYFIVLDIFVWILVFLITLIPFTTSFYILFGNGQTISCIPEAQKCLSNNQTVLGGMESYNKAMFFLFSTTFGISDIDFAGYNELDSEITVFFFALYIGVTTLILINVFIALLTSTFERVRSFSKSLFLLQRAKEILIYEHSLCESTRIRTLLKIPDQYIKKYKPSEQRYDIGFKDLLDPIAEYVQEINIKFESLNKKCCEQNESSKTDIKNFQDQIEEIKNSINILIEMNKNQINESNIRGRVVHQVQVAT
ncbi:transient receptor potential cation channel subfamily A member 1-like isoform X3 [Brachionus plicatilis]|uniref:Transient receptor potential cation channel subfamily A member 1-like isoform X3 n=1 Tax=Brachionus plicatilis TaxID=10195 RepID=A0A3M7SYS5_BRAPC|nr:transient receptor potential cation channel subfamily A member 1-like isoform X3 [Brachionus plicatilis]